jgi:hypothetical protein
MAQNWTHTHARAHKVINKVTDKLFTHTHTHMHARAHKAINKVTDKLFDIIYGKHFDVVI